MNGRRRGGLELVPALPLGDWPKGGAVVTWADAHRVANMAAAKAHAALGVDVDATRVDVAAAIRAAGVQLMWQPMPRIFGAYLNEPGSEPGILVNSGLPVGARRYTAGHELGHHWMAHTTSVDDDSTIVTSVDDLSRATPAETRRTWPDQEKYAEAFAAWFLMPRKTVVTALGRFGLTRPRTATDVYRLALLLGVPYRSTARHLPNLGLAHPRNASDWAQIRPGRLKAALDHGSPAPASRTSDVWLLDERFAGTTVEVYPGDRLVLPGVHRQDVAAPSWLGAVGMTAPGDSPAGMVLECLDAAHGAEDDVTVTGAASWNLRVRGTEPPRGLDPAGGTS